MVNPVVITIHEISEKQRRNVSKNNRHKRLDTSRREREFYRSKRIMLFLQGHRKRAMTNTVNDKLMNEYPIFQLTTATDCCLENDNDNDYHNNNKNEWEINRKLFFDCVIDNNDENNCDLFK